MRAAPPFLRHHFRPLIERVELLRHPASAFDDAPFIKYEGLLNRLMYVGREQKRPSFFWLMVHCHGQLVDVAASGTRWSVGRMGSLATDLKAPLPR